MNRRLIIPGSVALIVLIVVIAVYALSPREVAPPPIEEEGWCHVTASGKE